MHRLRDWGLRLFVWLQLLPPRQFAALLASLLLALGGTVPVLTDEEVARTVSDVVTAVVHGE
ncbi:hypothetical protein [Streptomyces hydrogenans]|uniref:hypothetical protein n=1 Tax=Streptomyces hydrogenans TaxID=1873719 RepID=UPI0035DE6690